MDEILSEMNDFLKRNTSIKEEFILQNNIHITDNTVIIKSASKMHEVLEDYVYPPIEEMEVYHYTSKEAAVNIQETNILRFYNILKRYGEGELKPFLEKFGFNEAFDKFGELKYISDYENIFYCSFLKVPDDDEETDEMKYLSELCDTRLKFRIKSTKGFFRKIKYDRDANFHVLTGLRDIVNRKNKKFIVEGMSGRLASFCIDEDYKIENEYRTYWRHWSKDDGFTIHQDENEDKYIEVILEEDNFSGIKIELLK